MKILRRDFIFFCLIGFNNVTTRIYVNEYIRMTKYNSRDLYNIS